MLAALQTDNRIMLGASIILLASGSLLTFPITMSEVSQRVGQEYLLVGTSFIFLVSQSSMAINSYVIGLILDKET